MGYYDDLERQQVTEKIEIDPKDELYSNLVNYTSDVLNACYKKLICKGSLVVVVSRNGKAVISEALGSSYFETSGMKISKIDTSKYSTTRWMRVFDERDKLPLYRMKFRKA